MRKFARVALVSLLVLLVAGVPAAYADPDEPHDDETHDGQPPTQPPYDGPIAMNVVNEFSSPKNGTVNSDLAFWGNLAVAGNYDGFRIFDISNPTSPQLLSDFACRGPQNDVSVYQIRGRLYLFQSIDRAQTSPHCAASQDTPIVTDTDGARASYGFEGIRMFDITNPAAPVFLTAAQTACGSHTHTLVPDPARQRLHLYVSSYPLGSGITPTNQRHNPRPCVAPHSKISIVDVPFANPTQLTVREVPLSSDTAFAPRRNPPFKACHDIQAVLYLDLAVGSCGGDVQIWDISDRANPATTDESKHTHFHNPQWDFMHNAMVTWDGEVMAVVDETGGGGGAECDGSASDDGFMYLYDVVEPGDPAGPEIGRYIIPRAQGTQICVTHNGQIIPVDDGRYLASLASYQGGTSIVDFTDPGAPREIGYIDTENSDAWSSYWYNGYVFANSGLGRRSADGSSPCGGTTSTCSNPGFEVYSVIDEDGAPLKARRWHHLNPQTQEESQAP